jgi:hypothetical protein
MNPRSIAALTPGTTATNQATAARKHGAHGRLPLELVEDHEREIFAMLAEDAPWRSETGELPRHDRSLVRLLAMASIRLQRAEDHIREEGEFTPSGKPKPIVQFEAERRRECARLLDQLGCTPAARARMGWDLVRTHRAEERLGPSLVDTSDPVYREELARLRAVEDHAAEVEDDPERERNRVMSAGADVYARLAAHLGRGRQDESPRRLPRRALRRAYRDSVRGGA